MLRKILADEFLAQQHGEQDQNRDRAHVNEYLNGRKKRGIQKQVQSGHADECGAQKHGAMHNVSVQNNRKRTEHRSGAEQVKPHLGKAENVTQECHSPCRNQ